MTYHPFKFEVVATVIQKDGNKVTGEATLQQTVHYGVDDLIAWANDFEKELEKL